MRALITGIAGFTGRYLAHELVQAGYEVFGLAKKPVSLSEVAQVFTCDLNDTACLREAIFTLQPDVVAHLAAISFIAHADPAAIYQTNLLGTRSLLDALSSSDKPLRAVLLASSANVYGNAMAGALTEDTPPNPANDYAVSKLAMEYLARLYLPRLPIEIARPFNYTGVGQAGNFLLPKIISHVRRRAPLIELGNLDVARDFSDVRMVVQVYRRLLETPSAIGGTFNIGSGRAYTLNEVLTIVRGISGHDFEVRVNPAFVRANEVKVLLGSRAKLEACIGAIVDIPLSETLRWMLGSN